ncbi:hypothetical protein J5226_04755 [Lysobacter sp. K5869]|uniref:hypothetical protein n=1 Tax=Lysobacter sp. K5869 TaxID=2820808 RepID=UPI001C06463C|nr:hypothetical protein [Lysobacter sp. K5869]QWP77728.1 hypothetical protein J5226_04755 [Lysobacter sp. K5869]
MTAAPARPALSARPVTVRLDGPRGRRVLHAAVDFDLDPDRAQATVFVADLGGFPQAGSWYWIEVAAPHPQAGEYAGRFVDWYNSAFYFSQVRRFDAPAPGSN